MAKKKTPIKLYMRDLRIEDKDVPKENREGEKIIITVQADMFPNWWMSAGSRKNYFLVSDTELNKLDSNKRKAMQVGLEKERIANMSTEQRRVEQMRKDMEGQYDAKLQKEIAKLKAELTKK